MPNPTSEPARIPEGFDPDKHCGALRVNDEPCMRVKGAGVPEYAITGRGGGRCSLHGGKGGRPIKHGGYSQFTQNFDELVEDQRNDPQLLDLRDEIAFLKIVLRTIKSKYATDLELYYEAQQIIDEMRGTAGDAGTSGASGELGVGPMDLPPMPEINTDLVRSLERAITAQHNMDYAKQFSIPKREVVGIVEQINMIFGKVCEEFKLGEDVKRAFSDRLRGIQISKDGQTTAEARGLVTLPS